MRELPKFPQLGTEARLLTPRREHFEPGRGHLDDTSPCEDLSQVQRAARTHICLGWTTLSWTLKNGNCSRWSLGGGKVNNLEGIA